jgi:hypothetical protein
MNISSAQLMKLLASGVRPADGSCTSAAPAGTASTAFADLLKQAKQGGLASELPVTLGSNAEGITLDEGQMARLSLAADQLETAGVRTALVSIDGQKLMLDVHARQIIGRATTENGITGGIDGVLDLGDARNLDASGGAQQSLGSAGTALPLGAKFGALPVPSATLAGNPDILKLLAGLSQGASAG